MKLIPALLCSVIIFAVDTAAGETGIPPRERQVEEIVVTGSHLKREPRDFASPLTVLGKDDLDVVGATDIKEIIRNMSFNSGSLGVSATNFAGDDSSTGNASVNLRNLGNGATLVLINGRRSVNTSFDNSGSSYVDVQGLVPNIALERIEVVKDGASALYGSDAVAGVVNFITRREFTGVELQVDFSSDDETHEQQDLLLSGLAGITGDWGYINLSASYLDRGGLIFADRFDRFGRSGLSSFGQPGRYVPQIPAQGATPVTSNYWWPQGGADPEGFSGSLPDPECEKAAADDGPMGTLGLHPDFSHICVYDYSSFFALVRPEEQIKFHSDGNFHLSPGTEIYGSFSYSEQESSRGNSLYPDVRYVIVPERHFGLQLDAARRGFDPVPYQALQRILGGTVESTEEDRPISTVSTTRRENMRALIGLQSDFTMAGQSWLLDSDLIYSRNRLDLNWPVDTLTSRMDLAFAGLGGPDCDPQTGIPGSGNLGAGRCYYYNSFQTSVYDPVTGKRWDTTDTSPWAAEPRLSVTEAARKYQNPAELLRWTQGAYITDAEIEQVVFDLVISGDAIDLPNGPLGLALGFQYRQDEARFDYDEEANAFNYTFLTGDRDWDNRLSSWSVFAEVLAPLTEWAGLTLAGRYESFEQLNKSTFDPKLTLLLRPADSLSLRASWGTSFRVGSLLQTGGSRTIFQNSSDPFSNALALAYRASAASGNPELKPEQAEVFNAGFSWNPAGLLDGFSLDLDYYRYDYTDLIAREGHQELIDRDNLSRCPAGANNDPEAGPLCGSWDLDGDGIVTVYSIGSGLPDKVVRREDGYLVRTEASYFNAPSLESSGIDLALAYTRNVTALGLIRTSLDLSYTLDYDIILANGEKIKGAGSRNAGNSIGRPMPRFRANAGLNWQRGRHDMFLNVRYINSYKDDTPQSAFLGAYIGYAETIDSMTTVDLQYRLELPAFIARQQGSLLTLGIKNLLNEEPPLVNVDGAYDYYTHDPRGRIFYARYQLRL